MSSTSRRCSPEVRERAVQLVLEQQREHESQWAAIAAKAGCTDETLHTDDHFLVRPSSSAAKKGDADVKISFARRNSRTSRRDDDRAP
jgi:transposase-like protein